MFCKTKASAIAFVVLGGLLGYAIASGHFNSAKWANTAQASSNSTGAEGAPAPVSPRGSFEDVNKSDIVALVAHNQDVAGKVKASGKKPNILVIWGDDIGTSNISFNNKGLMGYRTPNIDSIAKAGLSFTDYYGQQSCTAGRAAFIGGNNPLRTGMTKVGVPGATEGWQKSDVTMATVLKAQGYATGQFGKNHQGEHHIIHVTHIST